MADSPALPHTIQASMTTLTKNNDTLEPNELEHDKLSLHGMNPITLTAPA